MAAAVAVPLIVAGVGAATSGAIAYEGAQRQNRATKRAIAAENARGTAQARMVNAAAELEKEKTAQQAARIRGLIRVVAADSGSEGGSYDALLEQAGQDEALNQAILEENRKNQVQSVLSGASADILSLASHMSNSVLDSVSGGIGGFDAGLRIGGAANELGSDDGTKSRGVQG
jgi:hypothetical protein